MNSKSYLINIFLFSVFLLFSTAATNFIVDPGNIYPKYFEKENKVTPEIYVKELIDSKYGLFFPEKMWNDREIKKALAEYPLNYSCAIVGSSHLEQISSTRTNNSLTGICSSIKNLSVSGGTLEDFLAMTNIILKDKDYLPKTVVFGISPWSLNFGRDKRWTLYDQDYYEMKNKLLEKPFLKNTNDRNKSRIDLFLNLFNLQYFKRSIISVIDKNKSHSASPTKEFNHRTGLESAVILPDGSKIFSSAYIESHKNNLQKLSGKHSYKIIENSHYQDYAVKTFEKLIQFLRNAKVNVVFVLSPYRHKVWTETHQPIIETFNIIEDKVHQIAEHYKIQVIGSFNPYSLDCKEDEFFDNQHAMDSCLMKLENKSIIY